MINISSFVRHCLFLLANDREKSLSHHSIYYYINNHNQTSARAAVQSFFWWCQRNRVGIAKKNETKKNEYEKKRKCKRIDLIVFFLLLSACVSVAAVVLCLPSPCTHKQTNN